MSARPKYSLPVFIFSVAVVLWGFCPLGWAQNEDGQQEGQKSVSADDPTNRQVADQDCLDQTPEGDPLPDMPEPADNSSFQPSGGQPGSKTLGSSPDYVIGPEDVLQIEVFDVPELKRTVRVSNDGMIGLTLIGRVKASGLTADQLREALETKYAETYLQDPQISIYVNEFHAKPLSIIGAVERPGLYQLTGPRTLIEILSMAGGLAKRSSAPAGRTLFVTRKGGFEDVQLADGMELVSADKLEINIRKLLYAHDELLNIPIKPRDTISVTKADVVYVVGSVRKPGGFVLEDREKVTVMQALALAEGFFGSPAKSSSRVIRRAPDGSRTEIPVNLQKVLNGKAEDVEMAAGDILLIPDSTAKTAAKRGAEAAIGVVSGLIIWRR